MRSGADLVRVRWCPAGPCPARKWDSVGDLQVFRLSGGVRVLVDQAAQDGFSADLLCVDAGHRGAGSVRFVVGGALRYALVRPVRAENRIRGSDQQSCSPGAPPVMITGHVSPVPVPPDYAASR